MPQTSYTNADLKRFERKPLGVTIERPAEEELGPYTPPEGEGQDVDQLLADAKGSLSRANHLSQSVADENAMIDEGYAMEGQDSPSVTDSSLTKLLRLGKRIAAPVPDALQKAAGVGMFLAPEVAIPSKVILGAGSTGRLWNGGLQRVREHPIETGLDIAGVGLGVSAAKESGALQALKSMMSPATQAAPQVSAAGQAAQSRFLARQLTNTGYAGGAVKKITGVTPRQATNFSSASPVSHSAPFDYIGDLMEGNSGAYNKPASYEGLMQALEGPEVDPLEKFAMGPRIERGLGSEPTPEMRALYNRWMLGKDAPVENLNEAINPTAVRPRSGDMSEVEDLMTPNTGRYKSLQRPASGWGRR